MGRWLCGALALSLPFAAGCGLRGDLPKTYPAGGSVAYTGGQPMRGGSIRFTSAADPLLQIVGAIREDGTFILNTIKDKAQAAGAPEGEYRVIVQPPLQGHRGIPSITLPKPYKVEAKDDNQFRIELDVPPPRM